MPSQVEVLAAHGVQRPEVTIRAAADSGLELAAACVVVLGETGGGRMVWGHDTTTTGGIYTPGGPVTVDNWRAFRAAQRAQRIPRNGVGDAQLTSEEYLARAEQIGGPDGPADPYTNQRAGFVGLAVRIKRYGDRDGFVAYNGGDGAVLNRAKGRNAAAEAYGDRAIAQLKTWRGWLAGTTPEGGDDMAQVPQDEWNKVRDALLAMIDTWGGGTQEKLNAAGFLLRSNVETRQCWDAVKALQGEVAQIKTMLAALVNAQTGGKS